MRKSLRLYHAFVEKKQSDEEEMGLVDEENKRV